MTLSSKDLKRLADHQRQHGSTDGFVPTAPRPKRKNEEWEIQRDFFTWWRANAWMQFGIDPRLCFSVPNGSLLGENTHEFQRVAKAIRAKMLKDSGMTPGIPDVLLLIPANGFHALCLEFKTEVGTLSPEQKTIHPIIAGAGYKVRVVRSVPQAINEVLMYIKK